MECDAVVALARATLDGQTLFGQNSSRTGGLPVSLCRTPGRVCAADEKLRTRFTELPQARQTHTVLGCQPYGAWGYEHGINEHHVVVGCLPLAPTLKCDSPGLVGTDLARLALERSRTARQAVDLLTSFVERYGQGAFPGCPAEADCDSAFLVADPTEAYAVETAGRHWVYQEVQEVRAMNTVRVIRQDWDRISHGLASYAISHGWWSDDGSKLDFAGALGENLDAHRVAMRRWGRATLLLMEQSGHIDADFVRHLLSDDLDKTPYKAASEDERIHDHRTEARNGDRGGMAAFVVSLTTEPTRLSMSWCAFGPPRTAIYFPVFLDGEVPAAFTHAGQPGQQARAESFWCRLSQLQEQLEQDPEQQPAVRENFARLQNRLDQEAREFNSEGAALKQRGALSDLYRQATLFMQYNFERCETALADCLRARSLVAVDR